MVFKIYVKREGLTVARFSIYSLSSQNNVGAMQKLNECQIPCLAEIAVGKAAVGPQSLINHLKRALAKPWNYYLRKKLKKIFTIFSKGKAKRVNKYDALGIKAGDLIRIRPAKEIEATLDRWKELKGCAFLEYMWQYCGTTHRVLQSVERFLDERDYQVKKCKGIVLLEGVICRGTPVFGRCDRCCHLFWREEWLEKIDEFSN
ncbi:hypothetical protein [Syntrophus gentianae]|uniref:hypothetical protein n=1 Tax=Syntrophus gentianae TaxID=43775 RepID=UPI000B814F77|nr:hypothetical protein [Syntrophus gentianae]